MTKHVHRPILIPVLAAGLAVLTTACEPAERAEGPVASQTPDAAPTAAQPAAQPAYVGRWAANAGLCRDGAWDFRHDGLATAGEVSCRFDGVAALDDGYEIAATCTAQAPPQAHNLRPSLNGAGDMMVVRGGRFDSPPPPTRCPA